MPQTEFCGGLLLRRMEHECSRAAERSVSKVLPSFRDKDPGEELYLRCFDDIYGFRARDHCFGRQVYYLSPWEFLMLWECLPLPKPRSTAARRDREEAFWYIGLPSSPSLGDLEYTPLSC